MDIHHRGFMKILIILFLLSVSCFGQSNLLLFYDSDTAIPDVTAPDSVHALVATARMQWQINRTGTVVLSWTAETDTNIRQRTIYRSTSANPTISDSITTVAKAITSYTDSGRTSALYHYRMVSMDWAGNRSGYSANVSDTVYEFEVSRYLSVITTVMSDADKWMLNFNLVKPIKDSLFNYNGTRGIDSLGIKGDGLWWLACDDSLHSKLNIVNRHSANDITTNGLNTFTAYQGWTTNGTNGYLNTNFNPTSDMVASKLDSMSVILYIKTNLASNSPLGVWENSGGYGILYYPRASSGAGFGFQLMCGGGGALLDTAFTSIGCIGATRDRADSISLYKNGVFRKRGASASQTTPRANNGFALGVRLGGAGPANFQAHKFAFAWIGNKLNDLEQRAMSNIFESVLDYYGTGDLAGLNLFSSDGIALFSNDNIRLKASN